MECLGVLKDLIEVVDYIITFADTVKANRGNCRRLAERLELLSKLLHCTFVPFVRARAFIQ